MAVVHRAPAVWERIVRYLREVRTELSRVDWPSRKELTGSSLIVVVVLIVLALYLGALDWAFTLTVRRWLVGP
jgi:preprotein translocase subunit SecE